MVTKYIDILKGVSARLGTPFDQLMADDLELWHDFAASRYRDIYEYMYWPVLAEVEQVFVYDLKLQTDLGHIKAIFEEDPRLDTNQQPLDFVSRSDGYYLREDSNVDCVWVEYKPYCPLWTIDLPTADGVTLFYPEQVVLYQDYLFIRRSTVAGGVATVPTINSNQKPQDDTNYRYVRFPLGFINFLKDAITSDCYGQSGDTEKFAYWDAKARNRLEDEVSRITIQQNQTTRYNTYL